MATTNSGPVFRRPTRVTFGDGSAAGKILLDTTSVAEIELGGATSGDGEVYIDETYDLIKHIVSSNVDYRVAFIERPNNRARDPGAAMGLTRPQVYVYSETSWASATDQWICLTHDTAYGNIDSGTKKLQTFSATTYGGGLRTGMEVGTTADNTPTTILTIPAMATNSRLTVEAIVSAIQTDGSTGYSTKIMGAFYRDEGNVTQDGSTARPFEPSSTYTADFYIDVANHEVEVQVTGAAATNLQWKVHATWIYHTAS